MCLTVIYLDGMFQMLNISQPQHLVDAYDLYMIVLKQKSIRRKLQTLLKNNKGDHELITFSFIDFLYAKSIILSNKSLSYFINGAYI